TPTANSTGEDRVSLWTCAMLRFEGSAFRTRVANTAPLRSREAQPHRAGRTSAVSPSRVRAAELVESQIELVFTESGNRAGGRTSFHARDDRGGRRRTRCMSPVDWRSPSLLRSALQRPAAPSVAIATPTDRQRVGAAHDHGRSSRTARPTTTVM